MPDRGRDTGGTDRKGILEGYIDEREYCVQRGISLRTAQRERRMRQCPPHVLVGNKILYRVAAIRSWLLERERCFAGRSTVPLARGRR